MKQALMPAKFKLGSVCRLVWIKGREGIQSKEYWMIYRRLSFLAVPDLTPHPPLSPSPKQVVSLSPVFLWVACRFFWREREGWVMTLMSQLTRPRESLILYKSFNTLWYNWSIHCQYMLHASSPKNRFFLMEFGLFVACFRPVVGTMPHWGRAEGAGIKQRSIVLPVIGQY